VWHASVAPTAGQIVLKPTLHARALKALEGVGDRQHEWHEWTGHAYHIRRRLTPEEVQWPEEVRDIRGTPEAAVRYQRMAQMLPSAAHRIAREEIG